MVFSTTVFLFLFLPLFLMGYYLVPERARSAWILLGSWVFYGWWRLDFLLLLILTTLWNYLLGREIARHRGRKQDASRARFPLIVGLLLNLGSLGYFKYFNFAMESLNRVLEAAGAQSLQTWTIILPIGISFYIFQATSYLVDVYRGDAPGARRFVDLAAFIALFPQLIAGPILRYKDLTDQFRKRSHSFGLFSQGACRFMAGFVKKVLIADSVAVIADTAFALEAPGLLGSWLGTLAYASQLYFDFSGYSDMAIGLGLMMGFRFMENFNHPYISSSITEFWRRWHISLSTWLRDYLYIPLGGNRGTRVQTYRNLLLVMLLGGLWHGAAWNFVLWGLWHGLLLMTERLGKVGVEEPPHEGFMGKWRKGGAVMRTFILVLIGWVVFRAPDMAVAGRIYAGMLGLQGSGQLKMFLVEIGLLAPAVLAVSLVMVFSPLWKNRRFVYAKAALIPLFILSITKLMAETYSPFLYFQF